MELIGVSTPQMKWNDTNLPEAWDKFKRHVQLMFNGPLKDKSEEEHVAYLLIWIGDKGRDIQATWTGISNKDCKASL